MSDAARVTDDLGAAGFSQVVRRDRFAVNPQGWDFFLLTARRP
ncbi:MAG: hypothetical protein ABL961_17730 [Vicinamibacterales bacterium]